jgi:hypothetical protein
VYVTMCFFSLLLCDMRPFLPSCIPKILPLVWVHSRVLRANWRDSPACQELAYCPSQNPMCSAPPHPLPHTVHNTRTAAGSTGLSFSWPPPASQQLHHFPGSDWKGKPTFWGYAIPYLRGISFKIKLDFWLTWISCTY